LAALVRSSLSNRNETVTTPRITGDANLRRVLLPVFAGIAVLAAAATYFCWPKADAPGAVTLSKSSHGTIAAIAVSNNNSATTNNATPEGDAFEDEIVPFDGDFPQHQYPSTALLLKKPFCDIIDDNNVKFRYFDFPKDVVIGIMMSDHQPKPFKAYGRFKIPQSDWLVFIPTDAAQHIPGCLKRFSANDINCVRFDRRFPQDGLLEQVADIPDLQMLDLENCTQVTAGGAANLAKFKKLKTLDTAYSSIDGAMLSHCHLWDTLEDLNLASLQNPRPFLNQIGRYKRLQRLTLKETKLTNADFAAIASLPKLYYLDLSDNDISAEQLQMLTKMASLTELGLHGCGLGPDDFDVLRQFTRLHHIYLKEKSDKPGQWDGLQKLMPKVPIVGFGFIGRFCGY
jgi:Leucine-rich repeat (LRR) protein